MTSSTPTTPSLKPEVCTPLGEAPETLPAPVDIKIIFQDLLALRDDKKQVIIDKISADFLSGIRKLFEVNPRTVSKLEQFYGLLFLIAKHKTLPSREIQFELIPVQKLLLSSRVFSQPDVPKQISAVRLEYNPHKEKATYEVKFNSPEFRLALNQGKGFSNFREGLCQTAKELVFTGGFQFDVELTINKSHVFASNFKNVDIFGTFGSRGVVNVDIQYVSLRSVEFIGGSPMGIVRAKVSKREFAENEHSFLLRLVSSMVTDKSTQAIDW